MTARPKASNLGRTLFARLLATHLIAAAGALVIAVLVARDIVSGVWPILLGAAMLGAAVASLSAAVARSVTTPLNRIRDEVIRVGGGHDEHPADTTHARGSSALVGAVNRLANDLATRVDELRAETALREQVLSAMDEAVLLAEGTTVIYANPAAHALLGARAAHALPAALPLPDGDLPVSKELTFHHPTYRELLCTASRVADAKILVVAQDVTRSKRTERIRRDFVANASHELKTPVAGILASAETLHQALDDDPAMARRSAEVLRKEATRLSNLVQDLLSLSRVEQTLHIPEPVAFSRIAAAVVDELRPAAAAGGLALAIAIDDDISVRGSAEDLGLMVRNLLDNAIRYTPSGGSVRLTLAREPGRTVLRIADDGTGIPARDLPRIFERFYRVDPARSRATGGTGLGLSIVRHVAEGHGGSVHAESELGKGSTFTVILPAATI